MLAIALIPEAANPMARDVLIQSAIRADWAADTEKEIRLPQPTPRRCGRCGEAPRIEQAIGDGVIQWSVICGGCPTTMIAAAKDSAIRAWNAQWATARRSVNGPENSAQQIWWFARAAEDLVPDIDTGKARIRRRGPPPGRPHTITATPLTREELQTKAELDFLYRGWDADRPKVLADCLPGGKNEQRPCPWATCRFNLSIEVHEEHGGLKILFPDVTDDSMPDFEAMEYTCLMDVVRELGPIETGDVARLNNRSVERIRQLYDAALQQLRMRELREDQLVELRRTTYGAKGPRGQKA